MRNDSSGAVVEVEGAADDIDRFLADLRQHPPPLAVIESVDVRDVPLAGGTGFTIADTSRTDGGRTLASPDVAMCADCAAELRDPADRRYRHPFVNCTNCGPRFTIIAALPYDRSAHDDGRASRCAPTAPASTPTPPTAGSTPSRSAARTAGRRCATAAATGTRRPRRRGLRAARRLLRDGGILAVKGIGGYHLACDAGRRRQR